MISLKERLDVLLVQNGYFQSREKAKSAIMAGLVFVNKQISDKPGTPTDTDAVIEVRDSLCPYVGRGGLKLEKALKEFGICLNGAVAADIGASTGGFTDCMLQNGAVKVYAIDVGYGQLDYKLRIDQRVVNMEKVNVRYLDPDKIPEKVDFISIDVSFISVNLIFPVAVQLLKDEGTLVCLIKPQFEAGREQVGKHGIVKEKTTHVEVIEKVIDYGQKSGLYPVGLTYSPMTGIKGNIEYLMMFEKSAGNTEKIPYDFNIIETVDKAHLNVTGGRGI